MTATAPALDWKQLLETSTCEVFRMMTGSVATPATYSRGATPPPADFTVLVGLTGGLHGALSLRCQSMAAHRLTTRFLGEGAFPDDDVNDALGEIANRVAARLQRKVEDVALSPNAGSESIDSCFVFYGQPFWLSLWYTGSSPQE